MRRAVIACVVICGCFSPTEIDGEGSATEATGSETGSGSTMTTDPSASTAPTNTTAPTSSADTTSTTDPTDTGCVDECPAEGAICDGETLAVCAVGSSGCLELEATQCPSGCDGGACLGEPADLAISIVSAVFLQGNLQVTYVVANLGTGASGDYRVDLFADTPGGFDGPASVGDTGDVGISKPGLAPGEATQFTDGVPNAPNGRHVAFAVIDTLDEVLESDENNNASLGFAWTNTQNEIHTSFGVPSAPIEIPDDGTPVESEITVASGAVAAEAWVSMNVTHPDVADLTIELVAPDGQARVLAGPIPTGANLGGTTFRDGVGTPLANDGAPFLGEYEPATPWAGMPTSEGPWLLRITDTVPGNGGRINDWSVSVLQ